MAEAIVPEPPYSSFVARGVGGQAVAHEDRYLLNHVSWGIVVHSVGLYNLPDLRREFICILRCRNISRLQTGEHAVKDVLLPLAMLPVDLRLGQHRLFHVIPAPVVFRLTSPAERIAFELVEADGQTLPPFEAAELFVHASLVHL